MVVPGGGSGAPARGFGLARERAGRGLRRVRGSGALCSRAELARTAAAAQNLVDPKDKALSQASRAATCCLLCAAVAALPRLRGGGGGDAI